MAKQIEIILHNAEYRQIADLAASVNMKPAEVARFALRHTLADPQGFLAWLNRQAARVEDGARAIADNAA